jgi:hypothetical protein
MQPSLQILVCVSVLTYILQVGCPSLILSDGIDILSWSQHIRLLTATFLEGCHPLPGLLEYSAAIPTFVVHTSIDQLE